MDQVSMEMVMRKALGERSLIPGLSITKMTESQDAWIGELRFDPHVLEPWGRVVVVFRISKRRIERLKNRLGVTDQLHWALCDILCKSILWAFATLGSVLTRDKIKALWPSRRGFRRRRNHITDPSFWPKAVVWDDVKDLYPPKKKATASAPPAK